MRSPAPRNKPTLRSIVGPCAILPFCVAAFDGCLPRQNLDATGEGSIGPGGATGAQGGSGSQCDLDLDALPRVGESSLAIEAESADAFHRVAAMGWGSEEQQDAWGGSWLVAATSSPFASPETPCDAPRADFKIDLHRAGNYFVWLKGSGRQEGGSVRVGLDGVEASGLFSFEAETGEWLGVTSTGSRAVLRVPEPGVHRFHLWLSDGTPALDQIYLTTDEGILPIETTEFLASPAALRPSFEFNTDDDPEGWVEGPGGGEPPPSAGGRLLLSPIGGEVVLSRDVDPLDADSLSVLEVVGTFPAGVTMTVFFARPQGQFLDTDSVSTEPTAGGAETLTVNLSDDPDYAGTMGSLRILFSDVTEDIEMDSIRFVAPSVRGVDPDCLTGIRNTVDNACCPMACGMCGGTGCGTAPGGVEQCCADGAISAGACISNTPPCGHPR